MSDFVPISDADWPDLDVEVHWFRPEMSKGESQAWAEWFHQHGVSLGEGGGRVLIWRANQRGYVVRYIASRRIGWFNPKHGHEFFQLESPPLPFPV